MKINIRRDRLEEMMLMVTYEKGLSLIPARHPRIHPESRALALLFNSTEINLACEVNGQRTTSSRYILKGASLRDLSEKARVKVHVRDFARMLDEFPSGSIVTLEKRDTCLSMYNDDRMASVPFWRLSKDKRLITHTAEIISIGGKNEKSS